MTAQQYGLFFPVECRFDARFYLPPVLCPECSITAMQLWTVRVEINIKQRLRQALPLRRQKVAGAGTQHLLCQGTQFPLQF